MTPSVAVLGLGAMGRGMAANLAAAGLEVTVWNRTAARADELAETSDRITTAATPAEAAAAAEVIVAVVTDDEASRDVWLDPDGGAARSLDGSKLAIESSTLTPAWVVELGRAVEVTGARFLEGPVAGSRPQLAEGALVYLLGGTDETVAAAMPVLEVNSAAVRHFGPVGSAAIMKLSVNGLFAMQVAAYAEVVGFVERAGMDRDTAIEFLQGLPHTSAQLQRILGLFRSGDYAPNFPIELVAKDVGYLVGAAADVGAPTPAAETAREVFRRAVDEGHGGDDIAGLGQLYF